MKVDRESPIPAYYQIGLDLRRRIDNGEWRSGDRLPSEIDLANEYEVSRMTMRQAIAELVKEGFISRQRGSGTFVNQTTTRVIPHLSFPISFTHRIKELGFTPSARTLKAQVITAPSPEIAQRLKVNPIESIAYYKRVLMVNEQPMALNRSFIPYRLCPGLVDNDLIDQSISTTLERLYNLTPIRAEHWLEAVLVSDDAILLEINPGNPLLLLTTISYLENDIPP
jgi:DNA-binding GntR family transcriptional regulator